MTPSPQPPHRRRRLSPPRACRAAAQTELKLGHVGGPGSLFELSANEFARRANEKLGSKAKVVVFGSSQLGGDSEMMQKLRLGTLDFAHPVDGDVVARSTPSACSRCPIW